ncbi:hypothetical protein RhiirA1_481307, partial [Rhizophagus irregularis]
DNNLKESPLPKSTKNGKDYLNQITSPSLDFKKKVVSTYSGIDITLYYHPIFCAIQALLQRPEDDGSETKVFGEPYKGDWWLKMEKILSPLNHLLFILLYSDGTTFDGLGKTSGHPKSDTLCFGINGQAKIFAARISFFFADMLEADNVTTTYKGA